MPLDPIERLRANIAHAYSPDGMLLGAGRSVAMYDCSWSLMVWKLFVIELMSWVWPDEDAVTDWIWRSRSMSCCLMLRSCPVVSVCADMACIDMGSTVWADISNGVLIRSIDKTAVAARDRLNSLMQ